MFEKFIIDGWYCVAKRVDGLWVVWLKTKSKLEADIFFNRLSPPYVIMGAGLSPRFWEPSLSWCQ